MPDPRRFSSALPGLLTDSLTVARPPRLRPVAQFAEEEIVLPDDSPLRPGLRYSYAEMPWKRLLHAELQNPRWRRRFWAAPSQIGGKTLDLIIMLCWHLFECRHSCAIGGPDVDMIQSVLWAPKVLPVIQATRYGELLPRRGQGSRGGRFRAMRIRNGAQLYFMGAGGSDSQRTSLTVRALFLTELDQLAARSGASIESSPARSMEDRLRGWGSDAFVYGESVVHTKADLVWQEIESTLDGKATGSGSRIHVRCPHCWQWVWPDRTGLVGWQDAETEAAARSETRFACPECGALWTDNHRLAALHAPRLVHRGQSVDEKGNVVGPVPETATFGLRTNAIHTNPRMMSLGELGAMEWRAARSEREDDDQNLTNNVWNEPWDPEAQAGEGKTLTANYVRNRVGPFAHGEVPPPAERLTLGIDVGRYLCSWMLPGWRLDGTGWLVDAGEVAAAEGVESPEAAVRSALLEFLEGVLQRGWPVSPSLQTPSPLEGEGRGEGAVRAEGATEIPGQGAPHPGPLPQGERESERKMRVPDLTLIDSRWWPEVVYGVCVEMSGRGLRCLPAMGFGSTGRRSPFRMPRQTDDNQLGRDWYLAQAVAGSVSTWRVNVNADAWKRWVHARLSTPADAPGALLLWKPETAMTHMTTAKSLTSELWVERMDRTKGLVSEWKVQSRNNHRLDACSLAACAADMVGVTVTARPAAAAPAPQSGYAPAAASPRGAGWQIGR